MVDGVRIPSLLVLCLIASHASAASADPCKGAEPTVRSVARKIQALTNRASEAIATCTFHGASPALVKALREEGNRVAPEIQAVTRWETCTVNPSGLTVVGLVASYENFAGTTFTAALAACGPKQGTTTAPPAPDAVCKADEAWLRTWVQRTGEAAAKATDAAVSCAFKGANDKLLTDLARVMKPQIQRVFKAMPKKACKNNSLSSQDIAGDAGESAGKRLGLAVAMCSSKARKTLAEMKRAGRMTEEDVRKELGELSGAYIETVLGTRKALPQ